MTIKEHLDQTLQDILDLIGESWSLQEISSWTPAQKEQVAHWAGKVHARSEAAGYVRIPMKPSILTRYVKASPDHWVQTFTGRAVHLPDIAHAEIDIVDIAWHLSHLCRYTGATKYFYSVAEHCVHVSKAVPTRYALDGLLHDAPEYILGDLARPVKALISGYRELEDKIFLQIALKFGLNYPIPYEVKEADNAILANERLALMQEPPKPWQDTGGPLIGIEIKGWDSFTAYENFMKRYKQLTEGNLR